MSKDWTVGVMGAGRIAQGFDSPTDAHILTMAHAIRSSKDFTLGGFYDRDPARAAAAEKKWNCPASPRERETWLKQPWDVLYIATPDEQHAEDVRDALQRKPKAILVEKPFSPRPEEAETLLKEADRAGIPLLVDYPRRWHSGVRSVTERIARGELGTPTGLLVTCSGGVAHNGVHILDLFRAWWGSGWSIKEAARQSRITCLNLERPGQSVGAVFVEVPAEEYYVFEMKMYCTQGQIHLGGSPETLTVSLVGPDPLFPAFRLCRPVEVFDMEKEPLLCGTLEKLSDLIRHPAEAQRQRHIEQENETFISSILKYFSPLEKGALVWNS
jgi:predicted dehydrogenase